MKEDIVKRGLRDLISAYLMDTSEENHRKVDLILDSSQGLSTSQMPHLKEIWQHLTEGIIMLKIEGYQEPVELEVFDDCLYQIYQYLYQDSFYHMPEYMMKEYFEDMEADAAIEEYKSGIRE